MGHKKACNLKIFINIYFFYTRYEKQYPKKDLNLLVLCQLMFFVHAVCTRMKIMNDAVVSSGTLSKDSN